MVINLLCRPLAHLFSSPTLWTNCSILLTEMSSKAPGFIKWWTRCLNLKVAIASESERMCEAVSEACLHLSHSGLFTSPILNRCPLNNKCPVSNTGSILSWFLLSWVIPQLLLQRVFLRNSLLAFVHIQTASVPHVSYSSSPWSTPWKPLHIYTVQAQVLLVDVRNLA